MRLDGLCALEFGNGSTAGPTTTLFYTAGTFGEAYGSFGMVPPNQPQGAAISSQHTGKLRK
jgi:hypothetical protein